MKNINLPIGFKLGSRMNLLAAMFVLFANPVIAAENTALMEQARKLLNAGKAKQSAALLEQDLLNFAGNAEYDYLFGLALYNSGQTGQALFAFERVLMADPSNVDARLKAARINADRGESAIAHQLLSVMDKTSLQAAQQQQLKKINGILAAASNAPMSAQGYVLAGFGWDDNISSGPNQSSLFIPGLSPTPPAPPAQTSLGTAQRAADQVSVLELGGALRKAVAKDLWLLASGKLHQSFNRSRAINEEGIANLNLGVSKGLGRELFGFSLMNQSYSIAGSLYRSTLGARLNYTHVYKGNARLLGYIQYLDFTYPANAIDDATRKVAGLSQEFVLGDNAAVLQLGAYSGQEDAKNLTKPHFSFSLWGVNAWARVPLSSKLSLSAVAVYEPHKHLAADPLYSTQGPTGVTVWRTDDISSFGISADYKLDANWHLIPRYTYIHNMSNLALYDYTRNTFMLQLKREFK